MKTKTLLVVLALLASAAFAQTTYDVGAAGGTVKSSSARGPSLTISSPVTFVQISGNLETETGTVAITTGQRNGGLQIGCQFPAGGTFVVTTENEGEIFNGSITSATWQPIILANSTHFYRLTGAIQDTLGNTGTFVLQTKVAPTIPGFFNGKETVANIAVNFTLQ